VPGILLNKGCEPNLKFLEIDGVQEILNILNQREYRSESLIIVVCSGIWGSVEIRRSGIIALLSIVGNEREASYHIVMFRSKELYADFCFAQTKKKRTNNAQKKSMRDHHKQNISLPLNNWWYDGSSSSHLWHV